jgi:hypothetical protein
MTNSRDPHFMLQQPVEKGAKRMSVVSIMAAILKDELREHGVLGLTQLDCETMVRSVIERTAELGANIKRRRLEPHPSEPS